MTNFDRTILKIVLQEMIEHLTDDELDELLQIYLDKIKEERKS